MSTLRIKSIELKDVRGIEHLKLDALPDTGVIVIHGDNEAGKSTIVDALNVVLTERHTGSNKATKPLMPSGRAVGPEITVSMDVGPYSLTIFKKFLRSKAAKLTIESPERKIYENREADDRLEEILSEHLDSQLLETLFMRQDDLGEGISAVGIPSLTRALDEHADDGDMSAQDDTELMASIESEYRRYFTAKGKPTGDYAKLEKALEEAQARSEEAARELADIEGSVLKFERLERDAAEAQEKLPAAQEDVEAYEASLVAGRAAQSAYESAKQKAERTKELYDRAVGAKAQRGELVAARDEAAAAAQKSAQELEPLKAKAEEEAAAHDELNEKLRAARGAQEKAQELGKKVNAARNRLAQTRRVKELGERIARLDEANAALDAVREKVAARGREITAADVRAVENALSDLKVAQRLRETDIAKLIASASSDTTVTVDGEDHLIAASAEEQAIELVEDTVLTIGDVTLRYAAGAGAASAREVVEQVDKAQVALDALLSELGCESVGQVRERHDEHQALARELAEAESQYKLVLGQSNEKSVRAEYDEAVRATQAVTEAGTADDAAAADDADDADPADDVDWSDEAAIDAAAAEADEAERAAKAEVRALEEQLAVYAKRPAERALTGHSVKVEMEAKQAERAEAALAAAEEQIPSAQLEEAITAAENDNQAAQYELKEAEAAFNPQEAEVAEGRLNGAKSYLEHLEKQIHDNALELSELKGIINHSMGAAEKHEIAKAECEAAAQQFESMERRAVAAQYLFELMCRHRDEARARYTAPFSSSLAKLAGTVYGGDVKFELTDELEVAGRIHNGVDVPLEELSGGAKEQLAILTRFAIADLIAGEDEDPSDVPVVIDDALGSTDSRRLELMSMLFADAGKKSQVIVFTCMPERYARIPGRHEYSMEELKGL